MKVYWRADKETPERTSSLSDSRRLNVWQCSLLFGASLDSCAAFAHGAYHPRAGAALGSAHLLLEQWTRADRRVTNRSCTPSLSTTALTGNDPQCVAGVRRWFSPGNGELLLVWWSIFLGSVLGWLYIIMESMPLRHKLLFDVIPGKSALRFQLIVKNLPCGLFMFSQLFFPSSSIWCILCSYYWLNQLALVQGRSVQIRPWQKSTSRHELRNSICFVIAVVMYIPPIPLSNSPSSC